MPKIKNVDMEALCKMGFGEPCKGRKITGLYNNVEKTIFLNQEIDLCGNTGKVVILHELVHHYQFECGITENMTCLADLEPLAESIEKHYLQDPGQH